MRAWIGAATLFVAACGDDGTSPPVTTSLAESYDAAGILRVLEDGIDPIGLQPVYLLFEDLMLDGDAVTGTVRAKGKEAHPISGSFDETKNDAFFMPFAASLTTTTAEQVQELGFRGDDGRPVDGVLDDAPGFLQTYDNLFIREGSFLGVSRGPTRPERPDETKIRAIETEPGTVIVTAEPGAFEGGVGVELFRYRLIDPEPLQTSDVAKADGSFALSTSGFTGEAFLIRSVRAGVASDARAVMITDP